MLYSNQNLKEKFQEYLTNKITTNGYRLELNIILIGNDLASTKYIQLKKKIGERIGIKVNLYEFENGIEVEQIKQIINRSQLMQQGLIFQLPVPDKYQDLVKQTPLFSDVDLLSNRCSELWNLGFLPPTIGAIDLIIKDILAVQRPQILEKIEFPEGLDFDKNFNKTLDYQLDYLGQKVSIIGQGTLVGFPANNYFLYRQATVFSLNKATPEIKQITKNSSLVICGAGSADLVDKSWLNPETVVIDAGTSEAAGELVGDVRSESLFATNLLCPSPGGVGAITVLYLFYNLLKLHELE